MGLLDEIIAKLDVLPEAQLAALAAQRKASGPIWIPNPGRQTQALRSLADELFFGGEPGGGKSALLIGTAVTEHTSSIIFRREFAQIKGLEEEATRILGSRDGYNGQDHIWKLPAGRTLEFGSAQHEWSVEKYQGRAHDLKCVAPDTPVLMADGTFRKICTINVGDMVATLGGPRRVTRTHRWWKQAVRVTAWVDGAPAASQVQGATHRLLTSSGWAAPGSCSGGASTRCRCEPPRAECSCRTSPSRRRQRKEGRSGQTPPPGWHPDGRPSISCTACGVDAAPTTSVATGSHSADRYGGWSTLTSSTRRQALECRQTGRPQQREFDPHPSASRSALGFASAWVRTGPGSDCGSFACRHEAAALRSSESVLLELCGPSLRSGALDSARQPAAHDGDGVPAPSSLPGFPVDCWSGTHRDGGRPLPSAEAAQASTRRSVDAEPHSPTCLLVDALGTTRRHSHRTWSYDHPYGLGTRRTDLAARAAFLEVGSAGWALLCDLSVDDESHYITRGGFVNQNCFDEITHFSRSQYEYLTLWLRSTKPGQRCRVIAAGNPPTTPEGLWVLRYWSPWLEETHPDPAEPGELRWAVRASDTSEDDDELFFRSREEAVAHLAKLKDPPRHPITGEIEPPKSRTFIPGPLSENPDLLETGYTATLGHAAKALRALAKGDFKATIEDHPMQVIPTAWILAAEKRWTPQPPAGVPMTAIGVDPVQGGEDEMVIAPRHDCWFAEPIAIPGEQIPLEAAGSISAAHVVRVRRDNAVVGVDCGGGYGGSVVERLAGNDIAAVPVKGSESGVGRTKDRQHGFYNKRAELLWRFREALDPDQPGGSLIALPPRPKLRADLAAARVAEYHPRGIKIEDKAEIKARIGRSPDWGDAVVIAWALNQGNSLPYQQKKVIRGARPVVNIGNAAVKARRRRA